MVIERWDSKNEKNMLSFLLDCITVTEEGEKFNDREEERVHFRLVNM